MAQSMITPNYAESLARYNRWQNENLYGASETRPDSERKRDAGAFFKSIHGTLAHILWGDMTWMKRFYPDGPAAPPLPASHDFVEVWPDWSDLVQRRAQFDAAIIGWAATLSPEWLAKDLTWTNSTGTRTSTAPIGLLVAHFFNHQTHHRGQVHCLLTQAGRKPADTDLMLLR